MLDTAATHANTQAAPDQSRARPHALKEWAVAVGALARGETILLLRKGGIREQGGRFTVEQQRVWLYPTYEHQQPHLLQPAYASQVTPVEPGWHPAQVEIAAWAEITHILQIAEVARVTALEPFHIWNDQFVGDRLKWKPNQPLYALLLRVYALPSLQVIPYQPEYGGCRSWIELATAIDPDLARPVLSDAAYDRQLQAILEIALVNS